MVVVPTAAALAAKNATERFPIVTVAVFDPGREWARRQPRAAGTRMSRVDPHRRPGDCRASTWSCSRRASPRPSRLAGPLESGESSPSIPGDRGGESRARALGATAATRGGSRIPKWSTMPSQLWTRERAGALMVLPDSMFLAGADTARRPRDQEPTCRHMYGASGLHAEAGGLMVLFAPRCRISARRARRFVTVDRSPKGREGSWPDCMSTFEATDHV
jgi:hypothetical protein